MAPCSGEGAATSTGPQGQESESEGQTETPGGEQEEEFKGQDDQIVQKIAITKMDTAEFSTTEGAVAEGSTVTEPSHGDQGPESQGPEGCTEPSGDGLAQGQVYKDQDDQIVQKIGFQVTKMEVTEFSTTEGALTEGITVIEPSQDKEGEGQHYTEPSGDDVVQGQMYSDQDDQIVQKTGFTVTKIEVSGFSTTEGGMGQDRTIIQPWRTKTEGQEGDESNLPEGHIQTFTEGQDQGFKEQDDQVLQKGSMSITKVEESQLSTAEGAVIEGLTLTPPVYPEGQGEDVTFEGHDQSQIEVAQFVQPTEGASVIEIVAQEGRTVVLQVDVINGQDTPQGAPLTEDTSGAVLIQEDGSHVVDIGRLEIERAMEEGIESMLIETLVPGDDRQKDTSHAYHDPSHAHHDPSHANYAELDPSEGPLYAPDQSADTAPTTLEDISDGLRSGAISRTGFAAVLGEDMLTTLDLMGEQLRLEREERRREEVAQGRASQFDVCEGYEAELMERYCLDYRLEVEEARRKGREDGAEGGETKPPPTVPPTPHHTHMEQASSMGCAVLPCPLVSILVNITPWYK